MQQNNQKQTLLSLWKYFVSPCLDKETKQEVIKRNLIEIKETKHGIMIYDKVSGIKLFSMKINGKYYYNISFDEDSKIIKYYI